MVKLVFKSLLAVAGGSQAVVDHRRSGRRSDKVESVEEVQHVFTFEGVSGRRESVTTSDLSLPSVEQTSLSVPKLVDSEEQPPKNRDSRG